MSDPTEACVRMFGRGDLSAAFAGGERLVTPWRSACRERRQPLVEPTVIPALLDSGPFLTEVDPRRLRCTQPFVVAEHVRWYLSGEWERTGTTSADRGKALNRYPLIWRDRWDDVIILAGHHRAMAALIEGRPLRVRTLRPADSTTTAVLPRLLVSAGDSPSFPHTIVDDPARVAALVNRGITAVVPSMEVAAEALGLLGLVPDLVEDRLAMALRNRCRLAA